MPVFHAYASSDKFISWDMPDRKLMEAFEKWLANKQKEPDHFIGPDTTGKRLAVSFPRIVALVEQAPPAGAGVAQGSPALAGRPLTGS
jgi:broad specificity phosphatase PhoE